MGGDDVDDSGDVDVDVDGDGEVMVMIMAMASLMAIALSKSLGRGLSGPQGFSQILRTTPRGIRNEILETKNKM